MTRIESRPRRIELGRYLFFIDLDGSAEDDDVAEGIEALRGKAETVRVLGSYQVGGPPPLPEPEAAPSGPETGGRAAGYDRASMERGRRTRPGGLGRERARRFGWRARGAGAAVGGAPIGGRVLVLNATYEPIHVCTVRRATVLLLKAKAELIERGDVAVRSERLALERPVVIRLVTYVRIPRDVHRRKITRKAVLARDSWTCQYCGSERLGLTVDHVIPRSRGGELGLGEHRRRLRALQPAQGQPAAARDLDAPADDAEGAGPERLHPRRGAAGPGVLGALPGDAAPAAAWPTAG